MYRKKRKDEKQLQCSKISAIAYLYTIVEIFVLHILEVNVNLKLYQYLYP